MAEYYGSLAGADAYAIAVGNTAWTGTNEAKLAAMTRSSTAVDGMGFKQGAHCLINLWPGTKTGGRAQLRQWPRTGATDRDGFDIDPNTVPLEVEYASYEGAFREIVTPGILSPDYIASELVRREKVGPLEVEYAEAIAGTIPTKPIVSVIADLLAGLLSCNCGPAVFVV